MLDALHGIDGAARTEAMAAAPPGRVRRHRGIFMLWVGRVLVVVAVFVIWKLLSVFGIVSPFFVSTPGAVLSFLWSDLHTNTFWSAFATTMEELGLGLLIGCGAGIVTGLIVGYWKVLYDVIEPVFMALYTLPRIALAPLFIIWFGIDQASKIALVVSIVYFLMLLNTYQGVRGVDPNLMDSVRTMGASRRFIARRVILPSSVPWILAGFRLSAVYGISGAVVGEMILARNGLGVLLVESSNNFDTRGVFALLVVLGVLGFALNTVIVAVEQRLLRWKV